jgi:hypothetical protein
MMGEKERERFDQIIHVVGKALLWWMWDYTMNRLYIIDQKVRKNLCLFKAFQFPETSFVSVLSMSLPTIPNPSGNFLTELFSIF